MQQWDGNQYQDNSQLQRVKALEFYNHELTSLPSMNVVDIGCGSGQLTADIYGKLNSAKVFGIDQSESMLVTARSLYSSKALTFWQASATDWTTELLGLPEKSVGLVFSSFCLHWLTFAEMQQALQRIKEALNDKGRMRLILAKMAEHPITVIAETLIKEEKWLDRFAGFSYKSFAGQAPDLDKLLAETGFKDHKVNEVVNNFYFASKEAFQGWVAAWLPHAQFLQASERQEMLEGVWQMYRAAYPERVEEGKILYQDLHWHISACV